MLHSIAINFFKLCNAILSWENLTVSTRRTLRTFRDQQMNKLVHYSKEQYNFQSPGREGPLIIENHQSPGLGTLCSHKHVTSLITASRELLPIGQGGAAEEAGAGLCGSSVLRKDPCPRSQASVLELSIQQPGKWVIYPLFTDPCSDLARFSWLLYGNPSHQLLMKILF